MNIDKAQEIVDACCAHTFYKMGIREEPPPSLGAYSLRELTDANHAVAKYNDTRTDRKASTVCDDRLIAALYALYHYPGDNAGDAEAIVIGGGCALLCVRISDEPD